MGSLPSQFVTVPSVDNAGYLRLKTLDRRGQSIVWPDSEGMLEIKGVLRNNLTLSAPDKRLNNICC